VSENHSSVQGTSEVTAVADLEQPSGTTPTFSDQSLLRRFRQGQEDAATQLYLRYAERLRALAVAQASPDLAARVDPEDIVQSVFRTFFRRAAQGQYDVPEGEELWKLLLVIGLNKIRAVGAHHRAAKRDVRQTAGGDAYEMAVLRQADSSDETALTILRLVLEDVLRQLPPSQQQIIGLRIEGHEVAEIARRVGRAKRSVERVLQDFRETLKGLVQDAD
jgi:RNA polymerase sigma-70 factor (ECF subfamily)